jgi:hypothetical protein
MPTHLMLTCSYEETLQRIMATIAHELVAKKNKNKTISKTKNKSKNKWQKL